VKEMPIDSIQRMIWLENRTLEDRIVRERAEIVTSDNFGKLSNTGSASLVISASGSHPKCQRGIIADRILSHQGRDIRVSDVSDGLRKHC
jgi:hypothetical protein